LQLLCRTPDDGGLGLRDLAERFFHAIESAEERNSPSIRPGRN
jgi:hypothetical protein